MLDHRTKMLYFLAQEKLISRNFLKIIINKVYCLIYIKKQSVKIYYPKIKVKFLLFYRIIYKTKKIFIDNFIELFI